MQDGPVPRNNRIGIQLRQILQRLAPLGGIAVEYIGKRIVYEVAGNDDFLLREINDSVSWSVAAAQEFDLDFAVSEINPVRARICDAEAHRSQVLASPSLLTR